MQRKDTPCLTKSSRTAGITHETESRSVSSNERSVKRRKSNNFFMIDLLCFVMKVMLVVSPTDSNDPLPLSFLNSFQQEVFLTRFQNHFDSLYE